MSWIEWVFGLMLITFYLTCLFTVCMITFQKGYTVLGIIGIFIPLIWLICALLPAKRGSRYEQAQQAAYANQVSAVY